MIVGVDSMMVMYGLSGEATYTLANSEFWVLTTVRGWPTTVMVFSTVYVDRLTTVTVPFCTPSF